MYFGRYIRRPRLRIAAVGLVKNTRFFLFEISISYRVKKKLFTCIDYAPRRSVREVKSAATLDATPSKILLLHTASHHAVVRERQREKKRRRKIKSIKILHRRVRYGHVLDYFNWLEKNKRGEVHNVFARERRGKSSQTTTTWNRTNGLGENILYCIMHAHKRPHT